MRPLTLHVSALSDTEYALYTSSLNDLSLSVDNNSPHDDAYYENMLVGVREARAWLRGRFSDLPVSDIDMILKQFHPNLGQADSLSGGQFFAALRLVVHMREGKPFDRTLAFAQANPANSTITPPSPSKPQDHQPPPAHSQTRQSTSVPTTNPFSHSHSPSSAPPPYQQTSTNPFLSRSKGINGSAPTKQGTDSNERGPNPSKIPPLPPRKPPLPIPFVPPPRHAAILLSQPPPPISSASMKTVVSAPGPSSSKPTPPLPPAKINHITSTLMRQSLQASKAAQSMKKAEEELEKERVLSVLKSSSANGVNTVGGTRSASPHKQPDGSDGSSGELGSAGPPLPSRRRTQMPSPPSTAASMGSLGEVASASVGRGSRARSASRERSSPFGRSSPFTFGTSSSNSGVLGNSAFRASPSSMTPSGSPSRNTADLPPVPHSPLPGPPPTHPARKNSTSTSHSHSYSHSHVQPPPPPIPDSFDSVYAAGIDLEGSNTESRDEDKAGQGSANPNQDHSTTPQNAQSDLDTSPSPRVMRSRSMHYPSPVPVLPPRRRPESVQLPASPTEAKSFRGRLGPGPSPFDAPLPQSPSYSGLSRNASLSMPSRTHRREASFEASSAHSAATSSSSTSTSSPLTNIQRTLLKLDSLNPQKLQPKLDKARYKAEAGLSRKGYVSHSTYGRGMWEEGEQGLIGNMEDHVHDGDRYSYGREISDEEDDIGRGTTRRAGSHRSEGGDVADDLKWPAGEGWKPL